MACFHHKIFQRGLISEFQQCLLNQCRLGMAEMLMDPIPEEVGDLDHLHQQVWTIMPERHTILILIQGTGRAIAMEMLN